MQDRGLVPGSPPPQAGEGKIIDADTVAGLDPAAHIEDIAPAGRTPNPGLCRKIAARTPMNATARPQGRRINWLNVLTVLSAAILIGAEVFGGAFAAGWAFANLFRLEGYAVHILQGAFFLLGVLVMVRFIMNAKRVEPFTEG